jgi:ATP-dependent Clp protease ATP-binding subunit ClpC
MYQSLSQRVDRVIKLANRIAREYELEYVGTEHVLLAILREGTGLGAQILNSLGATEASVKEEINRLLKASLEDTWVFGRLPGSPHFRNVIAKAIEEAEAMKSKEVCTEHLLLALLREKGSVAYEALHHLALTLKDVRARVRQDAGVASSE